MRPNSSSGYLYLELTWQSWYPCGSSPLAAGCSQPRQGPISSACRLAGHLQGIMLPSGGAGRSLHLRTAVFVSSECASRQMEPTTWQPPPRCHGGCATCSDGPDQDIKGRLFSERWDLFRILVLPFFSFLVPTLLTPRLQCHFFHQASPTRPRLWTARSNTALPLNIRLLQMHLKRAKMNL